MEKTKKKPIYVISECAIFIAMAVALSYCEFEVGILGGDISPAMIPLFILCYRNGAAYGIGSGLAFGLLKCLIGGGIGYGLPSILLDYVLAYGAVGVAGFFKGKYKLLEVSVFAGCLARFAIHFISGVTIYKIMEPTAVEGIGTFANPVIFSLVYNMSYLLPTTVLSIVAIALLRIPIKKLERI